MPGGWGEGAGAHSERVSESDEASLAEQKCVSVWPGRPGPGLLLYWFIGLLAYMDPN